MALELSRAPILLRFPMSVLSSVTVPALLLSIRLLLVRPRKMLICVHLLPNVSLIRLVAASPPVILVSRL